ncbi:DUF6266 family protein [Pedobacter sp. L105]|uniref:DUF6266 family protein n=1 Tax=Pedobacter sp. L105 TaxID=1641871 RepID=UPI00131B81E4|nr:DUF6266 family protein [Pedobacter sp. L105]
MAIIKAGQVGDFSGKIGQVVVAEWRDLTVGRSTPKKSSKPPTQDQAGQRSIFLSVIKFLKLIKQTINIGYAKTGNLSAMNAAVKYHLTNAITGISPNQTIDFSKVVLSVGDLNSVQNAAIVGVTGNTMNVTWELDEIDQIGSSPTDDVYMLFYSPTLGSTLTVSSIGERSTLAGHVKMPRAFIGSSVHAWMFLVAVDGKSVSKSIYLGLEPVIA